MYLNVYRPSVVQRANGRALGGLVDSVFSDVFGVADEGKVTVNARFDVVEKADAYEAFIEIPGVAKEAIEINIEGNTVSVKAEATPLTAGEGERLVIAQRRANQYVRSFELPLEVADETAEASYENGVLKLVLPKKAVVQAKRLTVK